VERHSSLIVACGVVPRRVILALRLRTGRNPRIDRLIRGDIPRIRHAELGASGDI